jgi:FHA domain
VTSTCVNGHVSATDDYCDECGVRIAETAPPPLPGNDAAGGAGAAAAPAGSGVGTAPSPGSAAAGPVGASTAPGPAAGQAAQTCRICGAPRLGSERFCENDAYDFLTDRAPDQNAPTTPPAPTGWTLTVTADRGWWQEMATDEPFPEGCPERSFALAGQQILIGRPRPSRGIVVQVDLTGPPLDEGVSHAHALLTRTESGWQLSDAGSTNGTWLPGAPDPLAAGQYVLLDDGDMFFVGAWTKLALSQGPGAG